MIFHSSEKHGRVVPMKVVAQNGILNRPLNQKSDQIRVPEIIVNVFEFKALNKLKKKQKQVL